MKIDLDKVESGSHFEFDVCIAGAGIAGLTLAYTLLNSGFRVALLEGGGLEPEEQSQELYNVELAGHRHHGATKGRFRLFGGSSTRWGGQLLSYPDDVFNPDPITGAPRWPIQPTELEPFYPAVLQIMGVPDDPFEAVPFSSLNPQLSRVDDDINVRSSRWAAFSRRNLAHTLGKQCLESKSICVYLHANVTRLELGGPSEKSVTRIHVASFSGRLFTFSATQIVISLGVIENARLLLTSGIGNQEDQVGRYFHDHIGIHAATLDSVARQTAIKLFAPAVRGAVLYTPRLEATAKWRAKHRSQAVMAHFPIIEPDDSPMATLRILLQAVQQRELPVSWRQHLATLPLYAPELLRMAAKTRFQKRRAISKRAEFRMNIEVEQQPSYDSRITLSEQKDRFGIPRANVDWKISDAEAVTARQFAKTITTALQRMGVTPIRINPALTEGSSNWLSIASDTYHMMGGTRMGNTMEDSVVDRNLKVHGIENLYVAGCSVFPSGGSSNPTFTLMALSLRLGNVLMHAAGI